MSRVRLHDKEFEPYISERDVAAAIDQVAADLNRDFAGKRPVLIGVLNGAFFFAAELVKRLAASTTPLCDPPWQQASKLFQSRCQLWTVDTSDLG